MLYVLFIINPENFKVYYCCPFNALTGLECPGCGGLRGIHKLLHGNFVEALNYNLLLLIFVPSAGLFLLINLWILITGKSLPVIRFPKSVFWIIIIVIILYWILRNIIVIRF